MTSRAASAAERAGAAAVHLLDRLQRKARVPLGIHLQIADRCNHACKHCYQLHGNKGELPLPGWLRVLDNFARDGVLFLTVSGGEATLRPDLLEILGAARDRGFAVRLFTNAFLIDEALADRLAAQHLLAIHVSLYSHLEHEHDAVTGVTGSWKRTTNAVRMLTDRGVHVTLKHVSMKGCSSTGADMEQEAARLGALLETGAMILAREDGALCSCSEMHDAGGVAAIAQSLHTEPRVNEHPCAMCRSSLAVMPNGDIVPCTALHHRLGNGLNDSLCSIASSEEYAFLGSLTWDDVHGCRDCELQDLCGRCHADALLQTGDLLGPCESACRLAVARFAAQHPGNREVRAPGPYRVSLFGLVQADDVLMASDHETRRKFAWIHPGVPARGMLARRRPAKLDAGREVGWDQKHLGRRIA